MLRKFPPSFLKMLLLTASSSSSFALTGTVHISFDEEGSEWEFFFVLRFTLTIARLPLIECCLLSAASL